VVAFNEEKKLVVAELGAWAESVLDGTVDPNRKSEEVPESNDEPVKVIVGKTYDEFVTDRKSNIMVEFYGMRGGVLRCSVRLLVRSTCGCVWFFSVSLTNLISLVERTSILLLPVAPWCGHCKSLAPVYDELATQLQSNDAVVIAKIDSTANYVPAELGVSGFPTLIWFPVDGEMERYSGDRDLDSLKTWIEQRLSGEEEVPAHTEKDEL
jgi:protein disulfide-isomerase-like protein